MANNSLMDQIQIRGFVDGWARLTIEKWRKELRKRGIGVTDDLYNSFSYQLQRDREELLGVMFKFLYYGRLRDMNVGRGLKSYERSENTRNRSAARRYGASVSSVGRRKKNWYNKPKMSQFYRLRELLSTRMANTVATHVANAATSAGNINLTING